MAALYPVPFARLATRMFKELSRGQAIFDLPARHHFRGSRAHDLSVAFHGHPASTPLGPAAGPHWADGAKHRALLPRRRPHLRTEDGPDPRSAVDPEAMDRCGTVGYNVEWSQELTLAQSLEEYVKGSMFIEILVASGVLGLESKDARVIFDMSVGTTSRGSERPRRAFPGMMKRLPVGTATARAHGGPRPVPRPTVPHASLRTRSRSRPSTAARADENRAHRPPPPPSDTAFTAS